MTEEKTRSQGKTPAFLVVTEENESVTEENESVTEKTSPVTEENGSSDGKGMVTGKMAGENHQ